MYTLLDQLTNVIKQIGVDMKSKVTKGTSQYVLTRVSDKIYMGGINASTVEGQTFRRIQSTTTIGLGTIHLDFSVKEAIATTTNLFQLPANAPTPVSTIEVQLFDGGTMYIEAGQRSIKTEKVTTGNRYIVDMVGFFKV